MVLVAPLFALAAATLLVVSGPSGGVLENEASLQMSPASIQTSEGAFRRGIFDCDNYDPQRGTCWYNDWQHRDSRFASSCNNKGRKYSFIPPIIGGRCYCYKCQ